MKGLRQSMGRKIFLGIGGIIAVLALIVIFINAGESSTSSADAVAIPWETPLGYRVAYLISEDAVAQESLVSPSRMEGTFGARTVHRWSDVVALHESTPLDAVVIHDSAFGSVDRDYLSSIYRNGVVVRTFNVEASSLADLLEDKTISSDGFAEGYMNPFYVIVSRLILGEPEDVARIAQGLADGNKEPVSDIQHHASISGGRATNELVNANGYNTFVNVLVTHIEQIHDTRQDFEQGVYQNPKAHEGEER